MRTTQTCGSGRAALGKVLLDTHAWAWSLSEDARLSEAALSAMASSEAVYVSPISFFEIAQKVRLGKWPEMETLVVELPLLLERQGGFCAELAPAICVDAGIMEWSHRDPFDRLLAATSRRYAMPLVSADTIFDGVAARIW